MVLPPKNVTFSSCFSSSIVSGEDYYLIRLSALGCPFNVEGVSF